MSEKTIYCPFCYEDDFDLIGLKIHLINGWCDVFNGVKIPTPRGTNEGTQEVEG